MELAWEVSSSGFLGVSVGARSCRAALSYMAIQVVICGGWVRRGAHAGSASLDKFFAQGGRRAPPPAPFLVCCAV